jgi:iron complex transport system substrate-binding protein
LASYEQAKFFMFPPSRIICLTEETVETLYLLSEQDRIVGISGYVVRPPEGLAVHAFNQRTVKGILDMVRTLGAIVDASERAEKLAATLEAGLSQARTRAESLPGRPRVFFEEWDDPLISGIGWVSELIEIAGGADIFADRSNQSAAKERVVSNEEVVAREPDLIIGSWCGKKFRPERVAIRPGFDRTPAVQHGDLYEIKSSLILQPGPAALTDGLSELQKIIQRWAGVTC